MRSQQGAMPGWVKVILAVVVIGAVGVIALVWAGFSMVSNSITPDGAAKVAKEMVVIKEPLPTGWSYVMGMNMGVTKIASLKNEDASVLVQFLEVPNPKKLTAEAMLSESELGKSATKGRFQRERTGSTWIGGEKVNYVRGTMDHKGQSSAVEIGIVVMPSGKTIMIQEIEPNAETFDPELPKPILNSITKFQM